MFKNIHKYLRFMSIVGLMMMGLSSDSEGVKGKDQPCSCFCHCQVNGVDHTYGTIEGFPPNANCQGLCQSSCQSAYNTSQSTCINAMKAPKFPKTSKILKH